MTRGWWQSGFRGAKEMVNVWNRKPPPKTKQKKPYPQLHHVNQGMKLKYCPCCGSDLMLKMVHLFSLIIIVLVLSKILLIFKTVR